MPATNFDAASDPEDGNRRSRRSPQPFLGVQFRCCRTYGRLYRNGDATAYTGRCPRCGAALTIPIGHGGTPQRFFTAG